MTQPRIAVLGTGANGAAIGADLIRAGHDVTFIEQWPAHVEAMRAKGITVNFHDHSETTEVDAYHLCEVATMREPFDMVFVLVDAYDTRWACELIEPVLASDGRVIGLQNGMTIDDMADVVGADRTIGAVIEVGSNMFEPGQVQRQTPREKSWFALGSLDGRNGADVERVAEVLRAAGTVELSEDIRSSKWMKLAVNAAELVPSALVNLSLSEACELPRLREFMAMCGREAIEACLAAGSRLVPVLELDPDEVDGDFVEEMFDRILYHYALPDTTTTVLHDWLKDRRAEGEEINGFVVEVLREHGRSAPANSLAIEMAREVENGELRLSPSNVDRMVALLDRVEA